MDESRLYAIEEPAPEARKVLHVSGTHLLGAAAARARARSWPRQVTMRQLMRQPPKGGGMKA